MTQAVELLGTDLKLHKGQRVLLVWADNLPATSQVEYYARPVDGIWADGTDRGPNVTFPVNYGDAVADA